MTQSLENIFSALEATWPAATYTDVGPWCIRQGLGGGKRVSAATAQNTVTADDIASAEQAMRDLKQDQLFMIRPQDGALDQMLQDRGYEIVDPVNIYVAPVDTIATEQPPRVTAFCVWEPLAIQIDIWNAGGIGPDRRAVMQRVKGPKTALLGRLNDSPACAGFLAIDPHTEIAMVHAFEVLPHQRRQNMGVYAMRQAAFWSQDHGATHMAVVCTDDNSGANALYSSLGMQLVGQYHYRISK